jgi:hypothetical protein
MQSKVSEVVVLVQRTKATSTFSTPLYDERKSLFKDVLNFILQIEKKEFEAEESLCFHGELPLGEGFQPPGFFQGFEAGFVRGQSLADGAGLLGAEVQGNVLLALKRNTNAS